ncbi:hypothetical protein BDV95DRAFT_668810 [Massariosphaeria phaeospora]|uniref:Metalloendopeptidase n=1 Tax=Massariosphaeria phaeospora TaxID=100035 RepID=A0A7C8MDK3_9PLEO|nr:hypothetical protein BDV95DRAFT_668810 [Massariosphaeria phaeospora]
MHLPTASTILAILSAFYGLALALPGLSASPNRRDTVLSPLYAIGADNVPQLGTILDDTYGFREVGYTVVDDNVIIDGDILYGSSNMFQQAQSAAAAAIVSGDGHAHLTTRGHSAKPKAPWTDATVVYNYISDDVEKQLKPTVDGAIGTWLKVAPYLTFKRVYPNGPEQRGILSIQGSECSGCWATLGFNRRQQQAMRIQTGCTAGGTVACGVIETVHELGHVLGLKHEHQRHNRDDHIHLLCENIAPGCSTMPTGKTCCEPAANLPSGCCGARGQLAKEDPQSSDYGGYYDFVSAMHYADHAFALPDKKVMVARRQGDKVPSTLLGDPSKGDIARVCKIYSDECKGPKW